MLNDYDIDLEEVENFLYSQVFHISSENADLPSEGPSSLSGSVPTTTTLRKPGKRYYDRNNVGVQAGEAKVSDDTTHNSSSVKFQKPVNVSYTRVPYSQNVILPYQVEQYEAGIHDYQRPSVVVKPINNIVVLPSGNSKEIAAALSAHAAYNNFGAPKTKKKSKKQRKRENRLKKLETDNSSLRNKVRDRDIRSRVTDVIVLTDSDSDSCTEIPNNYPLVSLVDSDGENDKKASQANHVTLDDSSRLSDEDVIYVEPDPRQNAVIEIDDDRNQEKPKEKEHETSSVASLNNSETSTHSNKTNKSTDLNDFLGTAEDVPQEKFDFALHGSEFKDSAFLKPPNPVVEHCETESSCSTTDFNPLLQTTVFNEVEFPQDLFADANLQNFKESITPKRLVSVSSKFPSQVKQVVEKAAKCQEIERDSDSSSESDFDTSSTFTKVLPDLSHIHSHDESEAILETPCEKKLVKKRKSDQIEPSFDTPLESCCPRKQKKRKKGQIDLVDPVDVIADEVESSRRKKKKKSKKENSADRCETSQVSLNQDLSDEPKGLKKKRQTFSESDGGTSTILDEDCSAGTKGKKKRRKDSNNVADTILEPVEVVDSVAKKKKKHKRRSTEDDHFSDTSGKNKNSQDTCKYEGEENVNISPKKKKKKKQKIAISEIEDADEITELDNIESEEVKGKKKKKKRHSESAEFVEALDSSEQNIEIAAEVRKKKKKNRQDVSEDVDTVEDEVGKELETTEPGNTVQEKIKKKKKKYKQIDILNDSIEDSTQYENAELGDNADDDALREKTNVKKKKKHKQDISGDTAALTHHDFSGNCVELEDSFGHGTGGTEGAVLEAREVRNSAEVSMISDLVNAAVDKLKTKKKKKQRNDTTESNETDNLPQMATKELIENSQRVDENISGFMEISRSAVTRIQKKNTIYSQESEQIGDTLQQVDTHNAVENVLRIDEKLDVQTEPNIASDNLNTEKHLDQQIENSVETVELKPSLEYVNNLVQEELGQVENNVLQIVKTKPPEVQTENSSTGENVSQLGSLPVKTEPLDEVATVPESKESENEQATEDVKKLSEANLDDGPTHKEVHQSANDQNNAPETVVIKVEKGEESSNVHPKEFSSEESALEKALPQTTNSDEILHKDVDDATFLADFLVIDEVDQEFSDSSSIILLSSDSEESDICCIDDVDCDISLINCEVDGPQPAEAEILPESEAQNKANEAEVDNETSATHQIEPGIDNETSVTKQVEPAVANEASVINQVEPVVANETFVTNQVEEDLTFIPLSREDNMTNQEQIDSQNFLRTHQMSCDKYEVHEIQRTMSDDPRLWEILDVDRNRFLPTARGRRCNKCKEFGHMAIKCPNKSGPPKCSLCGQPGHLEPRCPNRICLQCARPGNFSTTFCSDCVRYLNYRCSICHMTGHADARCPDLWRRYHLTIEEGPLIEPTLRKLKPRSQRWCCGCAKQRHLEYVCCNYYNRSYPVAMPYIQSYQDIYGSVTYNDNVVDSLVDCQAGPSRPSTSNDNAGDCFTQLPSSDLRNKIDDIRQRATGSGDAISDVSKVVKKGARPDHKIFNKFERLGVASKDIVAVFMGGDCNTIRVFLKKYLEKLKTRKKSIPKIKNLLRKFMSIDNSRKNNTVPKKGWRQSRHIFGILNMILFGKQHLKDGLIHVQKMENFVEGDLTEIDTMTRESLLHSFNLIFGKVEEGPLIESAGPKLKQRNRQWCCGCAKQGHLEHVCYNFLNRNYPAATLGIQNYQDIYGCVTNNIMPAHQQNDSQAGLSRSLTSNEDFAQMLSFDFRNRIVDIRQGISDSRDTSAEDALNETSDPEIFNHFAKLSDTNESIISLFRFGKVSKIKVILKNHLRKLKAPHSKVKLKNCWRKLIGVENGLRSKSIPTSNKFWKRWKKIFGTLNKMLFGRQHFKGGLAHLQKIENFIESNLTVIDSIARESLLSSYNFIYGDVRHKDHNYKYLIKLLMQNHGPEAVL